MAQGAIQLRPVGQAIPTFEKTRNVVRITLVRGAVGAIDRPWAHLQGMAPFSVAVAGAFTPGVTTIQLYGWNDDAPPLPLSTAAPLSDPITKPGIYTYCAMVDW